MVCKYGIKSKMTDAEIIMKMELNTDIRRFFTKIKRNGTLSPIVCVKFVVTDIDIEPSRLEVEYELQIVELVQVK